MAVADKKGVPIVLAGRDFVIKRVPMARIKSLGTRVAEIFDGIDIEKLQKNPEEVVPTIMDKLLETPHAILSVFIKDLPLDIFLDEEDGVSFPEFLEALQTAVEVNRVDVLKNALTRLYPGLLNALRIQAS